MRGVRNLVVGAGFAGATVARCLAEDLGEPVLVVDARDHIGGQAFDETGLDDIRLHRYGPHIFHTTSPSVWSFVSRFTRWRPYVHRVLGRRAGLTFPVPFNFTSLETIVQPDRARALETTLIERFGSGSRVSLRDVRAAGDPTLDVVAALVEEHVFTSYTARHWGAFAGRVHHDVEARVPIVVGRDDRYFSDPYQGLPEDGYTALFERMLDHTHIDVELRHHYDPRASRIRPHRLFHTGCIDPYFGCALGRLPYRSVRIEFDELPLPQLQRTAVVNHLDDCPFTRTTEYKHFGAVESTNTVVSTEYPQDFAPGENEPCYPGPAEAARAVCGEDHGCLPSTRPGWRSFRKPLDTAAKPASGRLRAAGRLPRRGRARARLLRGPLRRLTPSFSGGFCRRPPSPCSPGFAAGPPARPERSAVRPPRGYLISSSAVWRRSRKYIPVFASAASCSRAIRTSWPHSGTSARLFSSIECTVFANSG